MAGPNSENSKTPRHVYKEMKDAGMSKQDAAETARESISKRRVPADARPNAEEKREKGG